MTYERRPFTFDRVVRILFSVCAILGILYLVNILKGVLLPFLVACLIAYTLEPIVKWNMRVLKLKGRFLPVLLTLAEVTAFISQGKYRHGVPHRAYQQRRMESAGQTGRIVLMEFSQFRSKLHNRTSKLDNSLSICHIYHDRL